MTDRERILRERINYLRSRPEPEQHSPEWLIEHARLMNCTVDEAQGYFAAARKAAREQTNRIIAMLERDLEELTKPYVAPLLKTSKPRRK